MPAMNDGLKLVLILAVLLPAAWFGLQVIAIVLGVLMLAGLVELLAKLIASAWRMLR